MAMSNKCRNHGWPGSVGNLDPNQDTQDKSMANYLIIGGDQKEYGPITGDEVRKWITEGRLNAQSRVKAESDAEWRPLSAFPEFADALAAPAPAPTTPPPLATPSAGWPERDYELDIGGCLSRGFELLKSHFGIVF